MQPASRVLRSALHVQAESSRNLYSVKLGMSVHMVNGNHAWSGVTYGVFAIDSEVV